ncbi:hypothetical protein [Novosphingobium sp. KACC 22771]|uniref:hypothetical protein n=1 Tax=Novosphingobium sp. KACC 22771 TaxID=3025670 RepID=UPI0023660F7B|nr:hypothetical protein [Novosphingobium sp. KACC 22771]WDF71496.1 hypothetical protein PQ467_11835 [Novosphingobium sp. KACC 22771]
MTGSAPLEGNKKLVVRRGTVDSVDLYEIKDSELDILERGSSADLQLNFSIFLVSIAFSAICALSTSTFASESIKTVFIVVSVFGILLGSYLILAWWRSRNSVKELCKTIRKRIAPESFASSEDQDVGDAEEAGAACNLLDEPPQG